MSATEDICSVGMAELLEINVYWLLASETGHFLDRVPRFFHGPLEMSD
jgi:hypothetical protein